MRGVKALGGANSSAEKEQEKQNAEWMHMPVKIRNESLAGQVHFFNAYI